MGILVVGGGPAGLATACFIREKSVVVIEEHKSVGLPLHCTSLVGSFTRNFFVRLCGNRIVENHYNKVFFYTPTGMYTVESRAPLAYRLRRPLLELKLLDRVMRLGHRIVLGERIKRLSMGEALSSTGRVFRGDRIVVAEGAQRILTRTLGLHHAAHMDYIVGVQAIAAVDGVDKHSFYTFFTRSNPWFFSWLVPIDSSEALIGTGYKPPHVIRIEKLAPIISRILGVGIRVKPSTLFGGLIPYEHPCNRVSIGDRIFFIGDTLPAIKPFTGGGLYGIAYLSRYLGMLLDDRISFRGYMRVFKALKTLLTRQYRIYRLLAGTLGTWVAPFVIGVLTDRGFVMPEAYYDRHEMILYDAARFTIKKPEVIFDILSSLKTLSAF